MHISSVWRAALLSAVWTLGAAAASAQDDTEAPAEGSAGEAPEAEAPEASEAEAQGRNDELARNHFRAGASYFDQERYPEAAREFREAFELSGRALLLVNMASAYERALEFDEARQALERFLELEPENPDRERVEARINHLARMSRAGATEVPEERVEPVPAPAASEGGLGALGIAGIAGVGLGVVLGAVSLGTGLVAEDIYVDLEMRCGADGACAQSGIGGRIDEGAQLALTSTVTAFVAAGALAAGLTLLLLDLLGGEGDAAEGDAVDASVRPTVLAGPEWAGLSLEGVW